MQPAHFKPKLPKNLSYPIGFEAISTALADVPFSDQIRLSFRDGAYWRSSWNAAIEAGEPYIVAVASFEKWDKRLGVEYGGESLHAGVWDLSIYPVKRELKSVARAALVEVGLPALRDWFCKSRPPSWYWGKKKCHLVFSPKLGTVEVRTETLRS